MKIIYLFFLSIQISYCQSIIPLPSNKSDQYEEHKKYYNEWIKKSRTHNHIIFNQDSFSVEEVGNSFYNRFNNYYKMMPDNPSDILYIFFDAFHYDKDSFCSSYNDVIRAKRINSWAEDYYIQEKPYMDKVCACVFNSYNRTLISKLKSMRADDQKYRTEEYFDSKKQSHFDSINQVKFRKIIEDYGYPDREVVGTKYEEYFVYILLHSNLQMMEEYFPIIKLSVEKNNLRKGHLAYLIDRINMLKGECQVFGTQRIIDENNVSKLYKVIDIENLNSRRESYHLLPIDIK